MDNQSGPPVSGDTELVNRLRAGDAAAFAGIVRAWSPAMIHVARQYVSSHASAEEAVQETWLAVIKGIDRFQGRSSLRTWVFHVLAKIAHRQGTKENRTIPTSPVDDPDNGCSGERNCIPGWANSARMNSAIRPPIMNQVNEVAMYMTPRTFGSVVCR